MSPAESPPEAGAPLYRVEPAAQGWRVTGPNGDAGAYRTKDEAQAHADRLNEEVAEEAEDDY